MGVLLKWEGPADSSINYDYTAIYRATSEAGTYSEITNVNTRVAIATTEYFDVDGSDSLWYKIRFYRTSGQKWSSYSTAIQGGDWKAYCTAQDVRNCTYFTETDLTDTQLSKLINFAGPQLNGDMNTLYESEKVGYINEDKQNKIDGSNTTFYVKNWPLGDRDNNMVVNTSDLRVLIYDSDGASSEATVSSIDITDGGFVLSSAPATTTSKMTVSYAHCPLISDPPNPMIRNACALLAAAWSHSKRIDGKVQSFKMGGVNIKRDTDAYKRTMSRYYDAVRQIQDAPQAEGQGGMVQIREGADMLD